MEENPNHSGGVLPAIPVQTARGRESDDYDAGGGSRGPRSFGNFVSICLAAFPSRNLGNVLPLLFKGQGWKGFPSRNTCHSNGHCSAICCIEQYIDEALMDGNYTGWFPGTPGHQA